MTRGQPNWDIVLSFETFTVICTAIQMQALKSFIINYKLADAADLKDVSAC